MNTPARPPRTPTENVSPPRWHRIYFWLAAFDVLTVTMALLLTHQIMGIYKESLRQNEIWARLLHRSSDLGETAAEVNEPGNEVFRAVKEKDPRAKSRRIEELKKAREEHARHFREMMHTFEQDLRNVPTESEEHAEVSRWREELPTYLRTARTALEKMVQESVLIFDKLNEGDAEAAGVAMALMDAELKTIHSNLAQFRRKVDDIQEKYFERHTRAAARYQSFEYAIGLGILLMVGAATLYGQKLALQATAHTQALRESELRLEQRVRERTAELEQANVALREGEERYRGLAKQVLTAQEDERRRIAHDLHDEIGQSLTSLLLGLRAAAEAPSFDAARPRLEELRRITAGTLDEVRRLARGLRPSVLDDLGLRPALERYAEDYAQAHGLQVSVQMADLAGRLPEEVETTLYRIVQEALTNTARHAQARRVRITAERTPAAVAVTVADDGRGFDGAGVLRERPAHRHLGLSGMRERAAMLNGTVAVTSAPGQGTTVRVTLPLAEATAGKDSPSERG